MPGRELLDAIPDAVVGVDAQGRVTFVNVQAEKLFGYERSEMMGQPVELLLPDRLREVHARHRADYHAKPTMRPMGIGLDLLARRKNGTEFPVEISLSPLRTVQGVQTISVIRDVTQRRDIEKERERLLEAATEARREAEATLQARLRAEGLKDDLTHMVVHDLKNPLNGIMAVVQLLLRKGTVSDAQRRSLLQIDRTCREMTRLVQNVLEIAKMEAGEMPVTTEQIDLADLIDEVAAEYGPVGGELKRSLKVAVGTNLPVVLADRSLLKRVLVNLIVNAFRHSGSTDVRIETVPDPGAVRIAIHVVDHGHGIPDADQVRLFEKFKTWPGDPTADTGLGLPFCKLAVERMQGDVALISAAGAGTRFVVTLPCVTPS